MQRYSDVSENKIRLVNRAGFNWFILHDERNYEFSTSSSKYILTSIMLSSLVRNSSYLLFRFLAQIQYNFSSRCNCCQYFMFNYLLQNVRNCHPVLI